MSRKVIEPVELDDEAKIKFLAKMGRHDIFPTAFQFDNELTLIVLLARKVVELEERVKANGPDLRDRHSSGE